MCMNCGCGDADARHHPTDITREDLQRAADGSGMTISESAKNVHDSTESIMADRNAGAGYASAGTQRSDTSQG